MIEKLDNIICNLISYGYDAWTDVGTDGMLKDIEKNNPYVDDFIISNNVKFYDGLQELGKVKDRLMKNNLLDESSEDYEDLFLLTYNLNTKEEGCASFFNDDKTIQVFEGNSDGSDDKKMDYETFVKNYKFRIGTLEETFEISDLPIKI